MNTHFFILIFFMFIGCSNVPHNNSLNVYDATLYKNKPANFSVNFIPINIIYESSLWPVGANKENPDIDFLKKLALKLKPSKTPYILDIEHWNIESENDQEANLALSKYIAVIKTMKETRPDLKFGYYGVLPNRDYWGIFLNNPTQILRSKNIDKKLEELAKYVDVICPTIYTFYNNEKNWVIYAKENIKRARKYKKPVFVFLWPQFHHSNKKLKGTFIEDSFWEKELEVSMLADSTIIWGGWGHNGREDWDYEASWWKILEKFIKSSSPEKGNPPEK